MFSVLLQYTHYPTRSRPVRTYVYIGSGPQTTTTYPHPSPRERHVSPRETNPVHQPVSQTQSELYPGDTASPLRQVGRLHITKVSNCNPVHRNPVHRVRRACILVGSHLNLVPQTSNTLFSYRFGAVHPETTLSALPSPSAEATIDPTTASSNRTPS